MGKQTGRGRGWIAQGEQSQGLNPGPTDSKSHVLALNLWFSNLILWNPWVLGAGQREGLRRRAIKGLRLCCPFPSSLWATIMSGVCVRPLWKICVANKMFSESCSKLFLLPWKLGSGSSFPRTVICIKVGRHPLSDGGCTQPQHGSTRECKRYWTGRQQTGVLVLV